MQLALDITPPGFQIPSGLTLSCLPLGLFCMHWLHMLLLSGFFHVATKFSGFTWTLVFHYQKAELCILSLVPKINRKGLTKPSLIYLPDLGLYTVLREMGDYDCSSSSHFTKPPGQGDKALWKDATLPWPGKPGWSCGVLVYICVFAWVFVLIAVYQKKKWSKTFALIRHSLPMLTKV